MLAMLVEQMAKLPDRAHFTAGNAFHPLAFANAGRGLGRLPPDMADDGLLVVAAGNLQAVDLQRPAAMDLRLGRVVDGPERDLAAVAREAASRACRCPARHSPPALAVTFAARLRSGR